MNPLSNADRLAAIAAEIAAGVRKDTALPGQAWFIGNDEILTFPRDDGDCRYPYGSGGFNFWAYTSGYMHSNEGIFSPFLRSAEGQEPKICWFAALNTPEGTDGSSRCWRFRRQRMTPCAIRYSTNPLSPT